MKLGLLDQEKLMDAIVNPPVVQIGRLDWTITDALDARHEAMPFVFGKLSKYAEDGRVTVVDEQSRSQINAHAPNLLEASSPFVYLPDYSGLAFLHVWNGIQDDVFPRRFKKIIESAYENFFVGCEVEPVADYQAFVSKLSSIKTFKEIGAKVFPPNPLFGRLWGSLNDYLKKRQASDVTVKEVSVKAGGLRTEVVSLIEHLLIDPAYQPETEPDIADAALLMAADGYGSGRVVGSDGDTDIIVRTADTQKSFLHDKEADPHRLAMLAAAHFRRVSEERDMDH
ncbi:hypothetical protein [Paraburkholderia phytofirmans]|uniref:Uncharacterized protein n=1 Tax=Paraburkholderia phytofirmans TaxID=261302 RepID=A0ABW9BSU4_9BURK